MARFKTKDVEALPWGFAGRMAIKRLTGRISEPSGSTAIRAGEALALPDAKAEVAWKDEKPPAFDAATLGRPSQPPSAISCFNAVSASSLSPYSATSASTRLTKFRGAQDAPPEA